MPTPTFAPARRRRGFTLVEIVVVVVIIAVLAAIAIVGYNAVISRGKTVSMSAASEQIGKVLQAESAHGQALISATPGGPGTPAAMASNVKVGLNTLSDECSGNYSLVGTKVGPDACGLTSRVMAA